MADTTNRGSNLRDKAQDTASSARQTAHDAKQTVQQGASAVAEKAKETVSDLGQRAKDAARNVGQRAQDVASAAGETASSAMTSMGHGMSSLGSTIRESAPREGYLGSAATTVASGLQTGGHYLEQHDLNDMAEDLGTLVKSHPLGAVAIAFGVGWLCGLVCRR
jgi:ElaB/YqjD/DUF883 family membrane-anchored ribosome-binding protein